MKTKKLKMVVLVLALVLALGGIIGGTTAWLSSQTAPVVNTFTYGDIDILLTETDTGDMDGNPNTNKYKMMPGKTIAKDPKVTVLKDSEDSWLFVKLEKSDNFDDFMTFGMADGWTALDGEDGVYFRVVIRSEENQEFAVIRDNTVTVKGEVTKEMLNALDESEGAETYPTLAITAYAVQYDADLEPIDTAADAWKLITETQGSGNGNTEEP